MPLSHPDEQRRLSRRAGVVSTLVLSLLISVDAGRASAETPQLAFFGGTSDVTLESGSFGRTRLRIPRAYYMGGMTGAVFKSHGTIMLEMALPDMRPRKTDVPLRGEMGSPEWLESLAENRAGLRVKIGPRETYADAAGAYRRSFSKSQYRRNGEVFGLEMFQQVTCSPSRQPNDGGAGEEQRCRVQDWEHYLSPLLAPNVAVAFNCLPERIGVLTGCLGRTVLDGLDIEYSFRRSELERWREIDTAVRNFVRSLIAP